MSCRPTALRRRASRPQLKRDPLGGGRSNLSRQCHSVDSRTASRTMDDSIPALRATMTRCHAWSALRFLLLTALACSSSVEPRSNVRLLVTNGTCGSSSCSPLQVLAFPSNQPRTPGGLWSIDLGLITAPSACLTLPSSATFRVIGVSNDGTKGDTTTFAWTTAVPLSLGAQPPSASRIFAAPTTSSFVPATAPGWSATLPGPSVSPTQACTP